MVPPLRPGTLYRPSGKFGLSSLLWTPLFGIPAAVAVAAAYAYATLYIPLFGVGSVLLTAGFGLLVGVIAAAGIGRGKARHPGLATLLGLGVGLVALYASWAVWIFAFFRRSGAEVALADLLLQPGPLWRIIGAVNAQGAWSIKGSTPTGTLLWVFWAAEALLVVGIPAFICRGSAERPFCERCVDWCAMTSGVLVGRDAPHDELVQRLKASDTGFLARLGAAEPGAAARIRYDLHQCACGATCTLTATAITTTTVKGKEREETTELVGGLVLTPEAAKAIRALGASPAEAGAVASAG